MTGFAGDLAAGDVVGGLVPVAERPVESLIKSGKFVEGFFFKDFDREEGDETDHGADREPDAISIQTEMIIIKSVLGIPEATAANGVDGVVDGEEMFKKL